MPFLFFNALQFERSGQGHFWFCLKQPKKECIYLFFAPGFLFLSFGNLNILKENKTLFHSCGFEKGKKEKAFKQDINLKDLWFQTHFLIFFGNLRTTEKSFDKYINK